MAKEKFKVGDVVTHKINNVPMVILGPMYEVPNRAKYTHDEKGNADYTKAYAKAVKDKNLAGYHVRVNSEVPGTFKTLEFMAEELVAI